MKKFNNNIINRFTKRLSFMTNSYLDKKNKKISPDYWISKNDSVRGTNSNFFALFKNDWSLTTMSDKIDPKESRNDDKDWNKAVYKIIENNNLTFAALADDDNDD